MRSNSNALEGSGPGAEVASASTAGPVAEVATLGDSEAGRDDAHLRHGTGDAMLDMRACVSGFASDTRPPLLATAKKARITSVHEEARLSGGIGFWTPESRALADFPTTELD